jgi:hypothetical protein
VTDDEARTTSRSKTRGLCPVVGLYGYYTAFAASCKGYSHQSLTPPAGTGGALSYDFQVFLPKIMSNLFSISPARALLERAASFAAVREGGSEGPEPPWFQALPLTLLISSNAAPAGFPRCLQNAL